MAIISFDATNIDPTSKFEALPAGWYNVIITESEVKETSAGTGNYLKVKYLVIDGAAKGRVVFDNINIKNPNADCERIGRQALSGICHAVGILNIQDSCQLHNLPLMIRLIVEKDKRNGEFVNRVREYAKKGAKQIDNAPAAANTDSSSPWAPKQ